jgi:hypothetical protein
MKVFSKFINSQHQDCNKKEKEGKKGRKKGSVEKQRNCICRYKLKSELV